MFCMQMKHQQDRSEKERRLPRVAHGGIRWWRWCCGCELVSCLASGLFFFPSSFSFLFMFSCSYSFYFYFVSSILHLFLSSVFFVPSIPLSVSLFFFFVPSFPLFFPFPVSFSLNLSLDYSFALSGGATKVEEKPPTVFLPFAFVAAHNPLAIVILLYNMQQVINMKTINTNYLYWRMQMKPYLIGQGVFPFVDTSFLCPAS